jgi:hypothetical protein
MEGDIEIAVKRAKKKNAAIMPWNISYKGPQFIAKDFKEY